MKIYLAGPLFSEAEQKWHRKFKKQLKKSGYKVVWPYELFDQEKLAGMQEDAPSHIMQTNRKALKKCTLVIALLEGPQVDDGTAWEIGYAWAKKIPVLGIRTDFRQCGDTANGKVNAMIHAACEAIVPGRTEALAYLKEHYPVVEKIEKVGTSVT